MIFMSPTLAFTSTLQVEASLENMVCCKANDVEDEELKDCCMMSDQEDANSCEDNNCNPNTCHFVQSSVFHVYFPKKQFIRSFKYRFYRKIYIRFLSIFHYQRLG